MDNLNFHSVTLEKELCNGCTNCIKQCPTEAIRVSNGKAKIDKERCIDCGMCIKVCPNHAKKAITDGFALMNRYKYKIALPAPSLYGQFKSTVSINFILNALISIGFDDVFEVASGAEIVTSMTNDLIKEGKLKLPVISSSCPAVVKLIQIKFPELLNNILEIKPPMEVAAQIARERAIKNTGLSNEEIGVFFITPCAAKYISIKETIGYDKSNINGVFPIGDTVLKILKDVDKVKENKNFKSSGLSGINWANSGGESEALNMENILAVDGILNVITILEEIENDRIKNVDFIETMACYGGCIGGPLNCENLFVAKANLLKKLKEVNENENIKIDEEIIKKVKSESFWTKSALAKDAFSLDKDFSVAIEKMEKINDLVERLPMLDCGSCGAPNCKALAEDIVRGKASETDCIFILKDKVKKLAGEIMEMSDKE